MKKKLYKNNIFSKAKQVLFLGALVMCSAANAQLSGTYTINASLSASSTNYRNFQSAVNDLVIGTRTDGGTPNGRGVSGAVIFNVANGTYNEQISIRTIPGASAARTVTFQSASGDSTKAILSNSSSTSNLNNYTLQLDSADFLIFRKLTIQRTGTDAYGTVVVLKGGAHKNTFANNKLRGIFTTSAAVDQALIYSPTDMDTGNTFTQNNLKHGSKGIYLLGISTSSPETGNIVTRNLIDSVADDQIWMSYQSNPLIWENIITNIAASTSYGITVDNSINGARIIKNKLFGPIGTYGIYLNVSEGTSTNRGLVANNFISMGGIGGVAGIYILGSSYYNFLYNSIGISSTSSSLKAIYVNTTTGGTGNQLFNNIISNTGGGLAVEVTTGAIATGMISASNYNDIYSSGKVLAKLGTTDVANLAAFRTATGTDANSISADPGFLSATDLHTKSFSLNGKATPQNLVTDDIDGEARSTTVPDIGADEFIPLSADIRMQAIIKPVNNSCGDSFTTIGIVIINEGSGSQSNFAVGAKVTGGTTLNLSQNYTKSLAPGAKDTVYFTTTFNTFQGGKYNITTYSALSGDLVKNNDTLKSAYNILSFPSTPVLTGAKKCGPGSLKLSGTSSTGQAMEWYSSTTATTPLYIGDTFTTPSLNTTTAFYGQKVSLKADALTTTFAGGSGQQGNLFDIKTKKQITIDSFDVHILGNGTETVEIYYKKGTYSGYETNASAWTQLGTLQVTAAGTGNPTRVKIGGLKIPANETYGMYVRLASTTNIRYTVGADSFKNEDLTIVTGLGSSGYFGTTFNPRTWNGTIYYYGARACASKRLAVNAVINKFPGGASLSQGSTFQGKFNAGTNFDRDVVCVGGKVQYALQPPTGFSNADYGTKWSVTSLTFTTDKGSKISSGVVINNPTSTTGGSLEYTSSQTYEDSVLVMRVTIQDLSTGCDTSFSRYLYVAPQPESDFSFTDACTGGNIVFTDKSTISKGTFSYAWNFGDGNTSTLKNPQHKYALGGNYTVSLKVTSFWGCVDSIAKNINVNPSPVADFTAGDVCLGTAVNFANVSTISSGSIASYSWDFGDGNKSNVQTPTHNYTAAGTYDVKLVAVSNMGCKDSVTKKLTVKAKPVAGFTANNVCMGESVKFTNTTSINPFDKINYFWEFGDGNTSTDENPAAHLYTSPGTYTVKLTAETPSFCSDVIIKQVTVGAKPVAKISTSGTCRNRPVLFMDSSTISSGNIASRTWNFGDGNTSTLASISHSYKVAGSYNITLKVTSNNGCVDSTSRTITVNPAPVPAFTATNVCFGEASVFTNTSTPTGATYFWSFGDGDTSTQTSPTHTYKAAGTYKAVLAVISAAGCTDSISKNVTVLPTPVASFAVKTDSARNVVLTPHDLGHPAYLWSFGDGNTSNKVIPGYKYAKDGTYKISLTITAANGCTSEHDTTITITTVGIAAQTAPEFNISIAPNPFQQQTQLSYELDKPAKVRAVLYDVAGKEVSVVANQQQTKGYYNYTLNADELKMNAGIYLLRVTIDDTLITKQIIRVK